MSDWNQLREDCTTEQQRALVDLMEGYEECKRRVGVLRTLGVAAYVGMNDQGLPCVTPGESPRKP